MTIMKNIIIEKVTLNVGAGKDQGKLEKGVKLIKHLTGLDPIKTHTKKRLQAWGLRPGLPIGCKLTIRDKNLIKKLLVDFLKSKENKLTAKQFDNFGNVSFGIHEYIDIPNVNYNPDIGIMGFQANITLSRPGMRVQKRRLRSQKIPRVHRINKEEAMTFMKESFQVEVEE
jgi:large subunit ribosomal protein L5